jgi:hypothetical protein
MMSKSLGFLLVLTGSFMNAEHVLPSNRSLFPLNFIESSIALNQKLQFTEYLKNNAPIDIEYDPRDQNEWIKNILIDFTDLHTSSKNQNEKISRMAPTPPPFPLPNVTQGCLLQLVQLAQGLTSKQMWALSGKFNRNFKFTQNRIFQYFHKIFKFWTRLLSPLQEFLKVNMLFEKLKST